MEYVPGFHPIPKSLFYSRSRVVHNKNHCLILISSIIRFSLVANVISLLGCAGIKINRLEMLDARGYSRSRISSRAIEAYLIQVKIVSSDPCE